MDELAPSDVRRDSNARLNNKSLDMALVAVESSREIIRLCQHLQESSGLARASYIEFSACRAAVLALLARSMEESAEPVRRSLADGIQLVRLMASANASTQSEVSLLTSLDAAIKRIDAKRDAAEWHGAGSSTSGEVRPYESFKSWAAGLHAASHRRSNGQLAPSPRNDVALFGNDIAELTDWPSAARMWDGEAQSLFSFDLPRLDDVFDFSSMDRP